MLYGERGKLKCDWCGTINEGCCEGARPVQVCRPKPLVYIDVRPTDMVDVNVWEWVNLYDGLLMDGRVTPVLPCWCLIGAAQLALEFTEWDRHIADLVVCTAFDACLVPSFEHKRIAGGWVVTAASRDTPASRLFRAKGTPVFYGKQALYEWFDSGK